MPIPVIGQGGIDSAEFILNLARSLVNDAAQTLAGNLLSDSRPYTFPELNAAYRQLQTDMMNGGWEGMQVEATATQFPPVYITDPDVRCYINFQGSNDGWNTFANPYLPANLYIPLRLQERPSGTVQNFREMLPVNDGLPSRPQSGTLQQWEWSGGAIYFRGSNQLTDIRIRYLQFFQDLTDGTSPVLIPRCDRALGYLMAKIYGAQRGSPLWQAMAGEYQEHLASLLIPTARKRQRGSHRRRPYGSSNTYWYSTYGGW